MYLVLPKVPLLSLLDDKLAGGQRPSLCDCDDLMVVSITGKLLTLQKEDFGSLVKIMEDSTKYRDFFE